MKKTDPSKHLEHLFLTIGPGSDNDSKIRDFIEYMILSAPEEFTKILEYFIRYLREETGVKKSRVCAFRYNNICSILLEKYNFHKHKFILDELSISILDYKVFKNIHSQMVEYIEAERYIIHEFFRDIRRKLKHFSHECNVSGRRKSILSVYGKILAKQNLHIQGIRDIFAFRVIIEDTNPQSCFQLLDFLSHHYELEITRYKDYVSIPKVNGYQSLHLGLSYFSKSGKLFPIELQIRTRLMHERAEHGIAAHHIYAQYKNLGKGNISHTSIQQVHNNSIIYCLSPEKDMVLLRKNHSLKDFANAIHSDLGKKIEQGYVNGIAKNDEYILKNGDIVQLITKYE